MAQLHGMVFRRGPDLPSSHPSRRLSPLFAEDGKKIQGFPFSQQQTGGKRVPRPALPVPKLKIVQDNHEKIIQVKPWLNMHMGIKHYHFHLF
jgi:hypothetical protein